MRQGSPIAAAWCRLTSTLVLACLLAFGQAAAPRADELAEARELLVAQVVEHARLAAPVTGRPEIAGSILEAMGALERHRYVAPEAAPYAYLDTALPAEHGLRESQPYIVALMTDLVELEAGDDVLILGVGGGYHAALASRLARRVYSVDLDALAVASVERRLAERELAGIELRAGDPYDGWPEADRRFDAIIVRLAIDRVPPMLLRQLAPGGRLVAPIGSSEEGQTLTLVRPVDDGRYAATPVLPVRFMRLPGGERL